MSVLQKIVEQKKKEVAALKSQKCFYPDLEKRENGKFFNAIFKDSVNIIAEVKKASPSAGVLKSNLNPAVLAFAYEKNGANAISVVTDKEFFQGSLDFLKDVRNSVQIPILRKDFTIDEIQIIEACAYKADAFLLIAAILSVQEMKDFMKLGESLGLDYIVEIHDEEDLEKVLKTNAPVIGINNRDLKTFQLNLNTTVRLAKKIPAERKILTESGIDCMDDVRMFLENQIRTFLIGSYFMKSSDPGQKLAELKNLRGL